MEKTKTTNTKYIYAKGGRKTATAQCRLFKNGKGKIIVNDKDFDKYFTTDEMRRVCQESLVKTSHDKDVDVSIKVHGSGLKSQAGACRHAISRALEVLDAELRPALKAEGFLKRDPRMKERKKPGLRGARRAPQWSKR